MQAYRIEERPTRRMDRFVAFQHVKAKLADAEPSASLGRCGKGKDNYRRWLIEGYGPTTADAVESLRDNISVFTGGGQ